MGHKVPLLTETQILDFVQNHLAAALLAKLNLTVCHLNYLSLLCIIDTLHYAKIDCLLTSALPRVTIAEVGRLLTLQRRTATGPQRCHIHGCHVITYGRGFGFQVPKDTRFIAQPAGTARA